MVAFMGILNQKTKNFIFVSIQLFLFAACSSMSHKELPEYKIYKGKTLSLKNLETDKTYIHCDEQRFPVFTNGNSRAILLAASYFSTQEKVICEERGVGFFNTNRPLFKLIVTDYPYNSEELNVDRGKVILSEENLARVARERLVLKDIYANSAEKFLFSKSFEFPVVSKVTSFFGTRRVFNNERKGQHLGIDLRGGVGRRVYSANAGRVVFVGELFYTGKSIIIDHGHGLFSLYGHLSRIIVSHGDKVYKRQFIGRIGMTGRTNGPHLHWGMIYLGMRVDGQSIIDETQKVFGK